MLEGFGKYKTKTASYQGHFQNNFEHGYGILTTGEFVYSGYFDNGLFSGEGA